MSGTDPVISNAEATARLNAAVPYAGERVVAVEVDFETTRPGSIGSGVVVEIAGGRFIVTAKHVVLGPDQEPRASRIRSVPRNRDGAIQDGMYGSVVAHELAAHDVRWWSPDLDVAILRAPAGLTIPAYPGDQSLAKSKKVATGWDQHVSRDAYLGALVTGFPTFAREYSPQHLDCTAVSLAGFVVGFNSEKNQLTLEIGWDELRREGIKDGRKADLFDRQLASQEVAIGGLSGGPVTLVLEDGLFLIGVFYEGVKAFSLGYAVPWHTVHEQFTSSLVVHP